MAVLPQLENELEAVPGATAKIREIAAAFRSVADDLEAEAGAVAWRGVAADQFRSKTAEVAQSFRTAADNMEAAADKEDKTAEEITERIRGYLETAATTASIVAPILAVIPGGQLPAAVAGIIGGLSQAAEKYLDDIWILAAYEAQKIWFEEWIPAIGEKLGDAVDESGERVGEAIDDAGEDVGGLIEDAGEMVGGPFESIGDLEAGLLESASDKAGDYVESAGDLTEAGIETATEKMSEGWEKLDDIL